MNESEEINGVTTIAPEVIMTIARLTALKIEGVCFMSQAPVDVSRLLKRGNYNDGVFVQIDENNNVNLDLYVILNDQNSLLETGRKIQKNVERAISEMVGMKAGQINVHIEDIYYAPEV